jgi:ABC-type bacteriocin/lantibiotic exporter with double-glycine peptidase domain
MSTPLLAFDRINFGYQPNAQTVLRAFSLDVQPGSVTAILGPNGTGKTTLLHLALGWLIPQSGRAAG